MKKVIRVLLLSALGARLSFSLEAQAITPILQRLKSFGDVDQSGNSPFASLLQGADGAFYGTTYLGGTGRSGTVYRLTGDGLGGYTSAVLKSLAGGPDGAYPVGALIQGADGFLYGTTQLGGDYGYGT